MTDDETKNIIAKNGFISLYHVRKRYERAAAKVCGHPVKIVWRLPPKDFDSYSYKDMTGERVIILNPNMPEAEQLGKFFFELGRLCTAWDIMPRMDPPPPNYNRKPKPVKSINPNPPPIDGDARDFATRLLNYASKHKTQADNEAGGATWAILGGLLQFPKDFEI